MVPLPEAAGPSMAMTKGFMRPYQAEESLKGKGIAAFRLLRMPARCRSPETSETPRCAQYLKRPSARGRSLRDRIWFKSRGDGRCLPKQAGLLLIQIVLPTGTAESSL